MLNIDKAALRRAMPQDPIAARRDYAGPALFSYGFRPFFLFGAIWMAAAPLLWIQAYLAGSATVGAAPALAWHVHEMLFGAIGAIVAGFLMTAVPNWTGRLPVRGAPLMALVALWLAGRVAMLAYGPLGPAAAIVACAFPVIFAALIAREVIVGGNTKNLPVCILSGLFAVADIGFHVALATGADWQVAIKLAVAVVALMIALIGGRIVPSFTRNWMIQAGQGGSPLPAPTDRFDGASLAFAGAALLAWLIAPYDWFTGAVLLIAGSLHAIRLARWQGWRTGSEPLVAVLHAGYAWLPAALILMGLAALLPAIVPASAALHALTAGAMGTMTLAVMTRASLGHTGRARHADGWTVAIYVLVLAGAILRVAAPFAPGELQYAGLGIAALVWSGAFALFALRYGPMLVMPRQGA